MKPDISAVPPANETPRRFYRRLWLVALLAGGLSIYLWLKHEQSRAEAFRTLCCSIGNDLVTNTNSERVAAVDRWSSTNFSAFVAVAATMESVKMGDKLSVFLKDCLEHQAHASARLFFTNRTNKHFEIRIRDVNSTTNYTVIGSGWWN